MMICKQLDDKFDWLGLPYGLIYPILVVTFGWMENDKIGKNIQNHDDDCVEEGFQLAMVKNEKNGAEDSEALGIGNRSINIWKGSELELAWSKKKQFIFKKLFSNTFVMLFRIHQFLRCVSKFISNGNFSNIFRSTLSWGR